MSLYRLFRQNVSSNRTSSIKMMKNLKATIVLLATVTSTSASTFPFVLFNQNGACADSNSDPYGFIEIYNTQLSFSRESPDACFNYCSQVPGNMDKLVGVTIGDNVVSPGVQNCWCQFTANHGVSANDYSNPSPSNDRLNEYTGSGNVENNLADGGYTTWCWRNEVSLHLE